LAAPYRNHVEPEPEHEARTAPARARPHPARPHPAKGARGDSESDEALVNRLRAGDRSAFDALYDRYYRRIYAFVDRRLSSRADTEETVQEVFTNVFVSVERYRGDAPFAAWIFGVTRRTIASRFKKRRHPTVPLHDDDGETVHPVATAEPSPMEAYEYQERVARLEELARTRLSPEQEKLFQLHHIEDRSIAEIASLLRKTENAVKSNLYRTRKLLLAR